MRGKLAKHHRGHRLSIMNNIKLALVGLVVSLALSGCSKSGLNALRKLKEEACACKTKACAEAVNKKMDDAMTEFAKGGEPSESDGKALLEIMEGAGTCLAPLMSGT